MKLKRYTWPVEICKVSFLSFNIMFAMVKTDAENYNTYPHVQTDSGRLLFFHGAGVSSNY